MIDKNLILLQTRKKLFTKLLGEHNTVFSGNGLEFKELREYTTNDDIRHINWKVTSRSLHPSVNIFDENRQLNVVVVYLNSGSNYFGSCKSKQDTMAETIVALCQATVLNNDMVTSIFFSDEEDKFYKPTKHKRIIDINLDTIYELDPLGKSVDYDKLNFYLANKIKKKSLIFLVGDFLDFNIDNSLSFLSSKHEVFCAIIRDKMEEDLELLGDFDFIDTNSTATNNISLNKKSIQQYNQALKEHDIKLFKYFRNSNIKYEKIYTHDNTVDKIAKLVTY